MTNRVKFNIILVIVLVIFFGIRKISIKVRGFLLMISYGHINRR